MGLGGLETKSSGPGLDNYHNANFKMVILFFKVKFVFTKTNEKGGLKTELPGGKLLTLH